MMRDEVAEMHKTGRASVDLCPDDLCLTSEGAACNVESNDLVRRLKLDTKLIQR